MFYFYKRGSMRDNKSYSLCHFITGDYGNKLVNSIRLYNRLM